jgi:nucleotide-binding universal stress UspA family protein
VLFPFITRRRMMFRKILVAYEGSDRSKRALELAVDIAANDGELYLVSIIENLSRSAGETIDEVDEVLEDARRHFEFLQEAAEARAARRDIRITRHVLPGHAAETIVHFAEQERVDLIVIGGVGRSPILRRVAGGTGSQIVYHAPCSVLVVR